MASTTRLLSTGLPSARPAEIVPLLDHDVEIRTMIRQIAERLYVTERTVEAHLTRVFRKLEVRSRTQLVGRLHSATLPFSAPNQERSTSAETRRSSPGRRGRPDSAFTT